VWLAAQDALHQRSSLSKVPIAGKAECLPHVSRHRCIDGGHDIGLSRAWANFRSGRPHHVLLVPSAETAGMLFWALLTSGQITMRKVDSWQTLAEKPTAQCIDLAA
jgi:hypothetical protein